MQAGTWVPAATPPQDKLVRHSCGAAWLWVQTGAASCVLIPDSSASARSLREAQPCKQAATGWPPLQPLAARTPGHKACAGAPVQETRPRMRFSGSSLKRWKRGSARKASTLSAGMLGNSTSCSTVSLTVPSPKLHASVSVSWQRQHLRSEEYPALECNLRDAGLASRQCARQDHAEPGALADTQEVGSRCDGQACQSSPSEQLQKGARLSKRVRNRRSHRA